MRKETLTKKKFICKITTMRLFKFMRRIKDARDLPRAEHIIPLTPGDGQWYSDIHTVKEPWLFYPSETGSTEMVTLDKTVRSRFERV